MAQAAKQVFGGALNQLLMVWFAKARYQWSQTKNPFRGVWAARFCIPRFDGFIAGLVQVVHRYGELC